MCVPQGEELLPVGKLDRFVPTRSATSAPIMRHALASIEAALLLGSPSFLVAPRLKVSSVRFGTSDRQARSKSVRALSKLPAVPDVHSRVWSLDRNSKGTKLIMIVMIISATMDPETCFCLASRPENRKY